MTVQILGFITRVEAFSSFGQHCLLETILKERAERENEVVCGSHLWQAAGTQFESMESDEQPRGAIIERPSIDY